MTDQRSAKRAIRARMAETGEKYTEARRALLGGGGAGQGPPGSTMPRAADAARAPYGHFTDQAYNQILLAEDEARMLGRAAVEPVHLLLALARRGNVHALFAREGVPAKAIFAAALHGEGIGSELVRGHVPRSTASQDVLAGALAAAAARGVRGPSTEHVLLALAAQPTVSELLRELGIDDVSALVDGAYPRRREPLRVGDARPDAATGMARNPPSPGPNPPLFERFSAQAHAAVEAGVASARELQSRYVEPAHLLIGLVRASDGVLAAAHTHHQRHLQAAAARAAELPGAQGPRDREVYGIPVSRRPTDIFTVPARALVAEQVLEAAHRLGDGRACLSSGHLLLATLESDDEKIVEALRELPDSGELVADVTAALPGGERMSL